MSNFSPKLQDSKDDQLWYLINESSPHYGSLASNELTRRALNKLRETTQIFNEQSSKQTGEIICLTWGIVVLTVIMVFGLFVQIYLAKIQVGPVLLEQQTNQFEAYDFCKSNPIGDVSNKFGTKFKCSDIIKMFEKKFEK